MASKLKECIEETDSESRQIDDDDAEENCSNDYEEPFVPFDMIKEESDYDTEDECLANRIKKDQRNIKTELVQDSFSNDICFANCGEFVDPLEITEETGIEADIGLVKTLEERIRESYLNEETIISCPIDNCDSRIRFSSIREHMKLHTINLGKLACPNCHKQIHLTMAHLERCKGDGVKRLSCTVSGCKAKFATKANLGLHLTQTHAPMVPCPYKKCNHRITSVRIKRHIKQIHGHESSCPHCGKEFDLDILLSHIEKCAIKIEKKFKFKTSISFFFCNAGKCHGAFLSEVDLRNHVRKVHESVTTKCPRANCRALVKLSQLVDHLKTVHEKTCESCGKLLPAGKLQLKHHIENCGVSTFQCTEKDCRASFKLEKLLKAHSRRVHESSIKCPHEDCNSYVKPFKLKSHFSMIHGEYLKKCWQRAERKVEESELQCKECGRSFGTRKLLTKHRRRVHSPPVKCPHENCQVTMKVSSLSRHILEKHGAENRACEKCGEVMTIVRLREHNKICRSLGTEVVYSTVDETIQSFLKVECPGDA